MRPLNLLIIDPMGKRTRVFLLASLCILGMFCSSTNKKDTADTSVNQTEAKLVGGNHIEGMVTTQSKGTVVVVVLDDGRKYQLIGKLVGISRDFFVGQRQKFVGKILKEPSGGQFGIFEASEMIYTIE